MKDVWKKMKNYLIKKLGRKGFTLIELLAVIVILAIVLVVTIPSVINSLNSAKHKQLQNAADTAADWLTKQQQLSKLGDDIGTSSDENYNIYCKAIDEFSNFVSSLDEAQSEPVTFNILYSDVPVGKNLIEAAGVSNSSENLKLNESYMWWPTDSKVCVMLTAKENGSFYVSSDDPDANIVISSGCE